MADTLADLVLQLGNSGILAGDTLNDFIPPKATPKDGEELLNELVRQKKLTKFQADEVSKGHGKSLILGNYVLLEKIGNGGMGQIFKAWHRRMDRLVALKLLPPAMAENKDAIARFEREFKSAAKISHQNVVEAHDADQANGIHFLVMELVEGSDLYALVTKNGPLTIDKSVNYILQAAKGLEAAHAEGIVHRDVKPSNLLLDKKGTVKVLDMGLARRGEDDESLVQSSMTLSGTIMGTVDYMAPEQALDARTADVRADIYALGCSLFYLLTGKPVYEGDTPMKKLLAHREQPIPGLRANRPEVPKQLESIFKKMIAKKIADRYQTMADVVVDLERLDVGKASSASLIHLRHPTGSPMALDPGAEAKTTLTRNPRLSKSSRHAVALERKRKTSNYTVIGAALLGSALLAGVIFSLSTKGGTLVVEVDQADATVQVMDAEGKIKVSQEGGKDPIVISVDSGKHRLKVEKEGFVIFAEEFEIQAGRKTPIKAKLVPLKAPPLHAETKSSLAFEMPGFDEWMKSVADLPAEKRIEAVANKLQELNPGFDGNLTRKRFGDRTSSEGDVINESGIFTDKVTDISPLRALTTLNSLACFESHPGQGVLKDLSPLKEMQTLAGLDCGGNPKLSDLASLDGLRLTWLNCQMTQVSDLSPLKGMKLIALNCGSTNVSDLTPLKQMPLEVLECWRTKVSDLSPLRGLMLTTLSCWNSQVFDLSPLEGMLLSDLHIQGTKVSDLAVLKGMPLTKLYCNDTQVRDLSPLNGMPLKELTCNDSNVVDLSPLKGMNLTAICFTPRNIATGIDVIRQMKSIKEIGIDWNTKLPADEFWKKYDAGDFGPPNALPQ